MNYCHYRPCSCLNSISKADRQRQPSVTESPSAIRPQGGSTLLQQRFPLTSQSVPKVLGVKTLHFFRSDISSCLGSKRSSELFGLHDSRDSVLISWHVEIPAIIQPLNWKKQLLKAIILQHVVVTWRQTLWDCSVSQTVPTSSGTSFKMCLSRHLGLIGKCSCNFPLLDMLALMATQYLAYVHTCDIQMCVCVFI